MIIHSEEMAETQYLDFQIEIRIFCSLQIESGQKHPFQLGVLNLGVIELRGNRLLCTSPKKKNSKCRKGRNCDIFTLRFS